MQASYDIITMEEIPDWLLGIVVALSLLLLVLCIFFGLIFKTTLEKGTRSFVPVEKKNVTGEALTYIIPYILGIIGFEFSLISIISMVIILVVMYFIYINSDLLAINPVLTLLQYRTFSLRTADGSNIFVITKSEDIILSKKGDFTLLTDKIYILRQPKEQ